MCRLEWWRLISYAPLSRLRRRPPVHVSQRRFCALQHTAEPLPSSHFRPFLQFYLSMNIEKQAGLPVNRPHLCTGEISGHHFARL